MQGFGYGSGLDPYSIGPVDPDPDPHWSPASTSGSGSVKNEYGSETLPQYALYLL